MEGKRAAPDFSDIQALEKDAESLLSAIQSRYNAEIERLQVLKLFIHLNFLLSLAG